MTEKRLPQRTIAEELAVRAARAFTINGIGLTVGFGLQVALARMLGVHEYGLYVYISTWVAVLSVLCILGFDTAAMRFIAEYRARSELSALWGFIRFARRRALSVSVALAVLLGVCIVGARPLQGQQITAYLIGALLLPVTVLLQLNAYFLLGFQRAGEAQALQLILRPALLLGGAATMSWVVAQPLNAANVLWSAVVTAFAVGAFEVWRVRRLAPPPSASMRNHDLERRWSTTASLLLLVTVAHQVLGNGDLLLVGMVLGPSDAGVYAAAARLATLVGFATTSINLVLAPTISHLYVRGEYDNLRHSIRVMTRVAVGYALLMGAFVALVGDWLLGLFGVDFVRGYWILIVLSVGQLVMAANGPVGLLMTMTGHQRVVLWIVGSCSITMVGVTLGLMQEIDSLGAAIAAAGALSVRSILLGHFVRKRLSVYTSKPDGNLQPGDGVL